MKIVEQFGKRNSQEFWKTQFCFGGGEGKAFIYFLFFFKFFLIFLIPVVSRSKKRSRRSTKHTRHRCDVKLGYEIANSQPEKTTKKRREENTRKFSATLKRRFFFLIKKKKKSTHQPSNFDLENFSKRFFSFFLFAVCLHVIQLVG